MEFKTNVIRPVECFREGWDLIKDRYWLFFGITAIGMLLGGVVPLGIIIGSMICGIYYSLFKRMDGLPVEFGDLFKGFDYFVPSLIVTLFIIVPTFVLVMVAEIFNVVMFLSLKGGRMSPNQLESFFITYLVVFSIFMLIMGLLLACLHALIMFAYPLIVEHKLSGLDAFKLSAKACWQNLNGILGIILIEFVLGFAGILVCGVGAYFVMPLSFAAVAVAYRKVFPAAGRADNMPPSPPKFVNQSQYQ